MNIRNRHTARTRWTVSISGISTTFLLAIAFAGCSESLAPPRRTGDPIGVQFMRTETSFAGVPFRVLLDFESPNDMTFIGEAGAAHLDPAVAHTGAMSLQIPGRSAGAIIKLNALLGAADFPGQWTLVGGYFISRESAAVDIYYEVDGAAILHRRVTLAPRQWAPVMLDLTPLSDPNSDAPHTTGIVRFKAGAETVWCDDVLAVDNLKPLVPESDKAGDAWTVRQRGFSTLIEKPGSFKLRVAMPEVDPYGWRVDEANELRLRLVGGNGRHTWTLYCDGRGYKDGRYEPAVEMPTAEQVMFGEQQSSPAELSVAEEMGRVERNSPGDRNNDGYEETTGAYQLKANGPRIEMTLTPRTAKLVRPVLEIAGLPQGQLSVNVEGRYIDKSVRLPNGHVLIEIPGTINRPVTVSIHVR